MIVGIDTSTPFLKLGLFEKEVISEMVLTVRESHTKHLLNSLNFLFSSNSISGEQIEGFGLVIGPGSFTGLRIGISTVIGISAAWKTPIYPVISGDIAWRPSLNEIGTKHFFYLLDGKRKELFFLHYIKKGDIFTLASEIEALKYDEVYSEISNKHPGGATIGGEGVEILRKEGYSLDNKYIKIIKKPYNGFTGGDIARFTLEASSGPVKNPEPLYVRDADIRSGN
ncbi:MAG: tRNA (adenosine(37)-N6)-threonylcarbamoyltransferase complex dimerization subunit type 1 TsaB [bacterium]|nr:tRNA (adenosine(37)-N6)-threonylcarbamoyltransferase complex dimerization subunit type 1 TsaB [bacterium]